jgi:chromosome segregation ATPase
MNNNGETPLDRTNADAQDEDGETPLDVANDAMQDLLRGRGAITGDEVRRATAEADATRLDRAREEARAGLDRAREEARAELDRAREEARAKLRRDLERVRAERAQERAQARRDQAEADAVEAEAAGSCLRAYWCQPIPRDCSVY